MDFELSDDQVMLKGLVERFVEDRYALSQRAQHRAAPRGYSLENWTRLADIGLLALPFSESDGGFEGNVVDIITVMESVGRGLVVEPLLDEIFTGGALLAAAGTAEQRMRWIRPIMAGNAHVVLAHAEHAARFDLRRGNTQLCAGKLHGTATFVPGGADAYIVPARDVDVWRLCLVLADATGLIRRDYCRIDGSIASELRFEGASAAVMAGGIESVEMIANEARIAACAEMVGIMTLLFDHTLDYVRHRQQFGASIGSFQVIQHRLAELHVCLEQARSLLFRGALAEAHEREGAIAAAKSYISTVAVRLGEECIQLHGGIGVSDELLIGQGHKRILLLATMFGDSEYELFRYHRIQRERSATAGTAEFIPPAHVN